MKKIYQIREVTYKDDHKEYHPYYSFWGCPFWFRSQEYNMFCSIGFSFSSLKDAKKYIQEQQDLCARITEKNTKIIT